MFKRTLPAILGLLMLVLTACGAAPTSPPASSPAAPAPTAPAHTTYPLTVKDGAGRDVTIPAAPQRILSLAPSNTELLWAVGKGKLQVGRTDFCDFPAEVKSIESIGGIVNPNVEKIAALKPDLVLMISGSTQLRDKLVNDLKLNVYVVNPHTFDEVYSSARQLGTVLDARDEAEKMVTDMQAKVKAIADKTDKLPKDKLPKVFYEVWDQPLTTAGPGSFISDMIRLAGGTNITDTAKEPWPTVSLEAVAAGSPDLIISPIQKSVDALTAKQRPGWNEFKAVKDGKVVLVPDQNMVSRPGPRLVQGLEWFAKTLHPELFK